MQEIEIPSPFLNSPLLSSYLLHFDTTLIIRRDEAPGNI
jgi:hypothetical protein